MIICCGEALIDMIRETDAGGRARFTPHSGGAIFNTAIALGRLRIRAALFSGLSSDLFGKQLKQDLQASGVETAYIVTTQRPTTLAFVELEDGCASYTFYDENTAGRMLRPEDVPALPPDVEALYFGGISLCSEPGADTYRELAGEYAANRCIILDPNIRPGFIEDEARYRERLDAMIALADIIKVSDEDLDWIMPGSQSFFDKAAALHSQGPPIVIVTRGVDGVSAMTADGKRIDLAAPRVRVVDTVGAGDTFNAGFMASLSQQGLLKKSTVPSISSRQLKVALKLGTSVAAVTISRAGADPPWRNELPATAF